MRLLIFDLDGTLIDSKLDLAHAVNATRESMGMSPLEHDRIYSYVGNGAPLLVRRSIGMEASDADVAKALEFFLAYYHEHMLDYTVLYPGVKQTLGELAGRGKNLAVLTNKPVRSSRAILEGLGIAEYFFEVYGGNSFEQKKPHPIGIERLMQELGVPAEQTLMVGDSAVDIQTARNASVRSCGVTYGFQPETLVATPPDYLIDGMPELLQVIS
jgi:phosphoglycolate phosphatase